MREIGEGRQKTLNIKGLARAALEREREVIAYRAEAVDRGRFPGIRNRVVASAGLAAEIPWGTGCDAPENRGDSMENHGVTRRAVYACFIGSFRRHTPYYGSLQSDYGRLQVTYSSPDRAAKRTQGIRDYMAAGHHGNTGIGGRGRSQGSTVHNLDKLAADGAAARA